MRSARNIPMRRQGVETEASTRITRRHGMLTTLAVVLAFLVPILVILHILPPELIPVWIILVVIVVILG